MSRNLQVFASAALIFYLIGAVNDFTAMYVVAAACLAVLLACYSLTRFLIRGWPQVELHATRRGPMVSAGDRARAQPRGGHAGRDEPGAAGGE